MNNERFILKAVYDGWWIKDNHGIVKGEYDEYFSHEIAVNLLNEQHETIIELQEILNSKTLINKKDAKLLLNYFKETEKLLKQHDYKLKADTKQLLRILENLTG